MANVRVHLGSEAFVWVGRKVAELSGAAHLALRLANLFAVRGLLPAGALRTRERLSRNVPSTMPSSLRVSAPVSNQKNKPTHNSAPARELEPYFPAARLGRLVPGISEISDRAWMLSPFEAWECVNLLCKKGPGGAVSLRKSKMTYSEENKTGSGLSWIYMVPLIDCQTKVSRGDASLVPRISGDFHRLREGLFEHLKATPLSFISPEDYAMDLSPRSGR